MRPLSFLLFSLLALAPFAVGAQGVKNTVSYGRTSTIISAAQEKQLQMLLTSADASGRLSIHSDRLQVKIMHSTDLAEGALGSIFQLAGLDLQLLQGAPGLVPERSAGSAGFPVFRDTGNPALDAQNHAAAKAAWIEAHPDAYQELLGR